MSAAPTTDRGHEAGPERDGEVLVVQGLNVAVRAQATVEGADHVRVGQRVPHARLRSQIRRTAKQIANRKSRETCAGSLQDLDMYSPSSNPDPLQQILLKEVFHLLSPQAKEIATWIWMGYSWREIGRICGIDHSTVRLAFRREAHAALTRLEPCMPIERRP